MPAGTTGEKVFPITYQFKLEYAKESGVRYLKSGGLMEAPIGGMGGMGGGVSAADRDARRGSAGEPLAGQQGGAEDPGVVAEGGGLDLDPPPRGRPGSARGPRPGSGR